MLTPFAEAIQTARSKAESHRTKLQESEATTRLVLIDPVLKALGWDVSDPGLVLTEYKTAGGRADYALIGHQGTPATALEAKKLGEPLGQHVTQMVTYANTEGIPFCGLTDGNEWTIYRTFQEAPIEKRKVMEVRILEGPEAQAALELLFLWRPNAQPGTPVKAKMPLAMTTEKPVPPAPAPPEPDTRIWKSLTADDWKEVKKPKWVRIPDGKEFQIKPKYEILVRTANWLNEVGAIKGKESLLKHQGFIAEHGSGTKKYTYKPIKGSDLQVKVTFSYDTIRSRTIKLMETTEQNPAGISIAD